MNAAAQNRHMLFAIVLVIALLAMMISLYPALASSYNNGGSTITGNDLNIGTVDEAVCQQGHAKFNSSEAPARARPANRGFKQGQRPAFCSSLWRTHDEALTHLSTPHSL